MSQPVFKLMRSTSTAARSAFQGYLITPDGKTWLIDANVSECDNGTGGKARCFTGTVRAADMRALVRGAKATGNVPADLVTAMAAAPEFDDELPDFVAADGAVNAGGGVT